jgi:ubiquinone/menaquinone biosynthesis C-methylase UbiE
MNKLARSHNWLIYRLIDPALRERVRRYAKGSLVDIGCGDKPYVDMTAPHVTEHVGVDHEASPHDRTHFDLVGTAYAIPTPAQRFDTVLCTDVLEHLEEPGTALKEAHRVLKAGGYAIYTVPLFWHLHEEPRDFYRYTRHGLAYLFGGAGFDVVEIVPLSGFIATFSQELVYYLYRFRIHWINPLWWIIPVVGAVVQALAFLLNKIDRSYAYTIEYLIVARKPVDTSANRAS